MTTHDDARPVADPLRRRVVGEDEIRRRVAAYEATLRAESGLPTAEVEHTKRPVERPLQPWERGTTTILFGGLTETHDIVLEDALEGIGYRVRHLPVPSNEALTIGKEYANRGQCNPVYYTVGNLVMYLRELRAAGVEDIEEQYVFLTAGSCGPCRFGMYEAEFRAALAASGFPDFRVILLQQGTGIDRGQVGSAAQAGIVLDATFFATILRAFIAADIVNAATLRIRPYEIEPGATDRALDEARRLLSDAFRRRRSVWFALRRARRTFDAIEVDLTRPKPRVKITGEFWAQTTEGDGSYHLQHRLESEGAEVVAQPVSTWIDYILYTATLRQLETRGLAPGGCRQLLALRVGRWVFGRAYDVYRMAFRFGTPPLESQEELAAAANDYYNVRIGGGEGHMEVGKHILSVRHGDAHMVASIKPFGCMPSTQSDGVQWKVVADLRDSIFLSIETTGDGEANVKSRVQMQLHEAKLRARAELQSALDDHGLTIESVRERAGTRRALRRPLRRLPTTYVGVAPNFVAQVARRRALPRVHR